MDVFIVQNGDVVVIEAALPSDVRKHRPNMLGVVRADV